MPAMPDRPEVVGVLRSRVITALGLTVLLVVAILYSPPAITAAILGLILLIGAWEWSAFLAVSLPWRLLYVFALAALGTVGFRYSLDGARFRLLCELGVAWWLVALGWIVLAPQRVSRTAAALAGALALLPTWLALLRIDALWAHGAQWTLFILALAFAADTGAFFGGRQFGRLPLAPRVSPNKTWEGVIGGMLLGLVLAAGAAGWFGLPAVSFVPLCLTAAGFSVVGDLTESLLKRHVHLKDSGRLFPGHGGVLDRIDSVTAATPMMALGLIWLGVGK
jgi:phosphatidate cytidylyltransferase